MARITKNSSKKVPDEKPHPPLVHPSPSSSIKSHHSSCATHTTPPEGFVIPSKCKDPLALCVTSPLSSSFLHCQNIVHFKTKATFVTPEAPGRGVYHYHQNVEVEDLSSPGITQVAIAAPSTFPPPPGPTGAVQPPPYGLDGTMTNGCELEMKKSPNACTVAYTVDSHDRRIDGLDVPVEYAGGFVHDATALLYSLKNGETGGLDPNAIAGEDYPTKPCYVPGFHVGSDDAKDVLCTLKNTVGGHVDTLSQYGDRGALGLPMGASGLDPTGNISFPKDGGTNNDPYVLPGTRTTDVMQGSPRPVPEVERTDGRWVQINGNHWEFVVREDSEVPVPDPVVVHERVVTRIKIPRKSERKSTGLAGTPRHPPNFDYDINSSSDEEGGDQPPALLPQRMYDSSDDSSSEEDVGVPRAQRGGRRPRSKQNLHIPDLDKKPAAKKIRRRGMGKLPPKDLFPEQLSRCDVGRRPPSNRGRVSEISAYHVALDLQQPLPHVNTNMCYLDGTMVRFTDGSNQLHHQPPPFSCATGVHQPNGEGCTVLSLRLLYLFGNPNQLSSLAL